nr:biotin/lipoate--protein ligase family protein [Tropicimonas isoalkanivorans]
MDLAIPPLMWAEAAPDDAFDHAVRRAQAGCDAGLVAHNLTAAQMQAALVLAPDVPLSKAVAMLPLCGVGLQSALGALAPPEVAVELDWNGGIRVNGGLCGGFRIRASTPEPDAVPDWLVVGFTLTLLPETDSPGDTPERTALYAEGCGDVAAPMLLEAWSRHTLNWIARWEDDGPAPLHAEWSGLAHGIGETVDVGAVRGTFLGIDEDFGMLLRDADTTHLIPLTRLLEPTS